MGSLIELTATDGHKFAAYTAGAADAKAGIVVVQEIFGVNHHIRSMADRNAEAGYSVIAPAVYDRVQRGFEVGYTPADIEAGRDVRMKLNDAQLMLDIEAAAKYLEMRVLDNTSRATPPEPARKLGIVGYCFGGTVAFWGATRSRSFSAASGWYGGGVAGTKAEVANCPLQLHFGEKDGSIPMTDVEAIRVAQPKAEIYVYAGAAHGFGCDERGSFSAPDYELAQKRTLEFFAKNLG